MGCDSKPQAAAPRPLNVVISGDTVGWITPCGCTSNQSGGLLRRGSYIADLRQKADVLYADVGGAVHGSSDYDRVKFAAILAGEKKMEIAAHNIGKAEAALGAATIRQALQAGAPIISANVRDESGQPIAPPMIISKLGDRRVALVGVLSPGMGSAGIRIDEPRPAILAALKQAAGQYDSLLVLAYCPQDELEQLAAALPEADAVIGGPTGQPIKPRRIGPTLLTSATSKGKFLATLSFSQAGQWSGEIVELGQQFPDQPQQQENLQAYLAELGRRDFTAAQSGLVAPLPQGTPPDYRVASSVSCAKCHSAEYTVWQHSLHSHAWQTLVAKHFEVDPECMQCHTTGFGLPGGFVSRSASAARVSVGCENCHGPSAAHVADPKRRTPFKASDQCTSCHDHENSPKFELNSYWARIRHGPATPAAAAGT